MSYDSKVEGPCGPKKTHWLNWIYYYKSRAFMHLISFFLSLHISKVKEMKSSKCKVKFPFFLQPNTLVRIQ